EMVVRCHESESDCQGSPVALGDPTVPSPPGFTGIGSGLTAEACHPAQHNTEGPLSSPPSSDIKWNKFGLRIVRSERPITLIDPPVPHDIAGDHRTDQGLKYTVPKEGATRCEERVFSPREACESDLPCNYVRDGSLCARCH